MNTIPLPETLNSQHVAAVQAVLYRHLDQNPATACIVLDASGVRHFDSASLALLLACRRYAQAQGKQLHVQGWPQGLLALAQVYGVLELLDQKSPTTLYSNA